MIGRVPEKLFNYVSPCPSSGERFFLCSELCFCPHQLGRQRFELPKIDNHLNIFYALTLRRLWIPQACDRLLWVFWFKVRRPNVFGRCSSFWTVSYCWLTWIGPELKLRLSKTKSPFSLWYSGFIPHWTKAAHLAGRKHTKLCCLESKGTWIWGVVGTVSSAI